MSPAAHRPGASPLACTVASIEAVQLSSGFVPWFPGAHGDPWNHVEAAMALSAGGRLSASRHAYEWLRRNQREDGAWHSYYRCDGSVEDLRLDSNFTAYVATGVWQHFLATGDRGFLEGLWPVVEAAIGFSLSLQRPGGELVWSVRGDGSPEQYALLTGSSSAYFSLRCAIACAQQLDRQRPEWELAAGRLRHAIAYREGTFAAKRRYAMDWYYPVLSGAVAGEQAVERIRGGWEAFVVEGAGVRCVSDRRWVTVAETAECAVACLAAGLGEEARELLAWVEDQRDPSGSYTTGLVYPERSSFPHEERTTYSAAAVVLALDALRGESATSRLFLDEALPAGLDLDSCESGRPGVSVGDPGPGDGLGG